MSISSISNELVSFALTCHNHKLPPTKVRALLLEIDTPKGTASKVVTIVTFLNDNQIQPEEVTSLSTGYALCQSVKRVSAAQERYRETGEVSSIIKPIAFYA